MNRQGKVYRIHNEDKTAWVDVLRFSSANLKMGDGKEMTFYLDWKDGETEPGRLYEDVVVPSTSVVTDGVASPPITIKAIKEIKLVMDGKEEYWLFVNDPDTVIENRQIDYFVSYALESNDPGKDGMDWEKYKKGLGKATSDNASVVSAAVSGFRVKRNDKEVYYQFDNSEILDAFDKADKGATASTYLDPFQVIVGVSTQGPEQPVPKYFWFYTDFVYNSAPPYPNSHEAKSYYVDWGSSHPGPYIPDGYSAFSSYVPSGSYWEFIQFPYSFYDPSYVAEAPLAFATSYDKNGVQIWFGDYEVQKQWDDYIKSKLVTTLSPPYPFRPTSGFDAVYGQSIDKAPLGVDPDRRSGGIAPVMTRYQDGDYEAPRVEGLKNDLDDYRWYIDPPSLWLSGLRASGAEDWWLPPYRWDTYYKSVIVPMTQEWEETGRLDFSITASFDGEPLEVIGWNSSYLFGDMNNYDWYDSDPLEGPPYFYASPVLWIRVLCKLPDKE